ncbi:LacI family DNA-binding transcriptional regulator [Mediterraneibacter sp. NSJ-55]|uniref:LacI family DNA-binding transcriptional regulator n=1 Tax=Mediterraneibacter hominis TaxID=2763054 RepID=A0A923LIY9_9FIRM|nr:LacI family DNA-binding transcriptional regulator [Mediterraneibacter hominis]MBC5689119.1 LacI family DNA-binding transcriptional regulator [Mediterraneibacter hominis]
MTVREIAKLAGVSPSSVSRYFTENENVSKSVAEKIEAVLGKEEGQTQVKSREKNKTLVLITPHKRLAFYSELLRMFMEQAPSYGIQIVFLPVYKCQTSQCRSILTRLKPHGFILLEEDESSMIYEFARKMKIPVVLCAEDSVDVKDGGYIHVNDVLAAYEGTRYLLGLGHRKIVFFTNYGKGVNASYQRIIGCTKAMSETGLAFEEPYVQYGALTRENGYAFAQKIIKDQLDFTAIFAFSDEMACGAICGLQDMGIRVPQDVSVLGFDDLPIAEQIRPRLTTMHQPLEEFIRCALDFFSSESTMEISREIMLPHSIIIRDSCASVKKGEGE